MESKELDEGALTYIPLRVRQRGRYCTSTIRQPSRFREVHSKATDLVTDSNSDSDSKLETVNGYPRMGPGGVGDLLVFLLEFWPGRLGWRNTRRTMRAWLGRFELLVFGVRARWDHRMSLGQRPVLFLAEGGAIQLCAFIRQSPYPSRSLTALVPSQP